MKQNKKLIVCLILGVFMIMTGIIIWRESSFIISGLGIVVVGIGLMTYFNNNKS